MPSAARGRSTREPVRAFLFRIVEDVYYQHLDGHVDPHRWRGYEAVLRDVNTRPGVQAWWRSHSHWFDGEEFAKFINQQQQTATRHDD
jgi:hypothetical protein